LSPVQFLKPLIAYRYLHFLYQNYLTEKKGQATYSIELQGQFFSLLQEKLKILVDAQMIVCPYQCYLNIF